jgi:hypothetical protein
MDDSNELDDEYPVIDPAHIHFSPSVEHLVEIAKAITTKLDAMSPEERAEHETTRRFRCAREDEELLAALSPEERQRILERREEFHDRMWGSRPIWLGYRTILDALRVPYPAQASGASAALRAMRGRRYRRPRPRADGW